MNPNRDKGILPKVPLDSFKCPDFNLGLTLGSGQTFHWTEMHGGFTGCIGETAIFVKQSGETLSFSGGDRKMLSHYFALDHDLDAVRSSSSKHPVAHAASLACRGLRIMRQPHWECLATFILSPMKQVSHIRQMSLALRKAYGKSLVGTPVPAFPEPSALASANEEDLRRCGLGFRAKGLLGTARMVNSGEFDLESIEGMETEKAREELCKLPGIGRKVANCILLFSYERLEAVPVDVWIGRILSSFRSPRSKTLSPAALEAYGEKVLGPYAGYLQQYLFHQARTGSLAIPIKAKRLEKRAPDSRNPVLRAKA